MNYTKGPWRYEPGTKTIRTVPGNHWLATLDSWDGAIKHQNDANGIAMAASPTLIQALQLAEATIRRLDRNQSAQGTLDVIRIALAEAGA